MLRSYHLLLICLWLVALPGLATAAPNTQQAAANVEQAWKLLDYMATDYPEAVEDGAVVDADEYAEQQEFAQTAQKLISQLPTSKPQQKLYKHAQALVDAVNNKVTAKQINTQALGLAQDLLAAYPVPSTPDNPPDLEAAATLYAQTCASCHGALGDGQGPAAANLSPEPIAFTDIERADHRSPLSLYQALSQGLEGTSMAAYADVFTQQQRWDLAYYIGSLAYSDVAANGQALWENNKGLKARISSLEDLSKTRVAQLAPSYGLDDARAIIGWLRTHPKAVTQAPQGLELTRARLGTSLSAYQNGQQKQAVQLALSAYLDGFEANEARLDTKDKPLRKQIEAAMGAYRSALSSNQPVEKAQALAKQADQLLAQAQDTLATAVTSPTTAFVGAYTILVREGLEALLVVIALLAVLSKAGRPAVTRYVHYGWILALVAGGLTWAAANYLISISGASRELTEGLSALFAAIILVGVGLWMHNKSIGNQWQKYIKNKIDAALHSRTRWLLFILAFITVYREVFETILFYIALWNDGQHQWVLLGMAAAIVSLAIIAWVLLKTSQRLPISKFFSASTALIAILAFVLAGKGAAALQEAGWLGITPFNLPRIDLLGIYPTWQTITAQVIIVLLMVIGFLWNKAQSQKARALNA